MTHRVRLLARYAVNFEVYVRGGQWLEPQLVRAKDVSRGGLFVCTTGAPEIFAELKLRILLPWGGELKVKGRAVHVVTEDKVKDGGWDAGCGIEFQDLTALDREVILELVEWARGEKPSTIPSLDALRRHLIDAAKACASDDMEAAARSLAVLEQVEWGTPELRKVYEQVVSKVDMALASPYLQQERYETRASALGASLSLLVRGMQRSALQYRTSQGAAP